MATPVEARGGSGPARRATLGRLLAASLLALAAGCPDTSLPPLGGEDATRTCTTEELAAFREVSEADERLDLWIAFIDVGHGDAIWIRTPGDRNEDAKEILIDAGDLGVQSRPDGADAVLDFMRSMGYLAEDPGSPLDYLVLSHPDSDHYGGMAKLVREHGFRIRTYIDPGFPETQTTYKAWLDLLAAHPEIEVRRPLRDFGLQADEWGRQTTVAVLSADPDAPDKNSASIVLALEYRGVRVLLPGDAEKALELALVDRRAPLTAQVLKAAHHGSQTSSTPAFLERIFPADDGQRYVVVTAGRRDSLPHEDVIDRLVAKVGEGGLYRTDRGDRDDSMAEAPGDDHVLVRIREDGELTICYAYPDSD